ncbi:unnamed protein product [Dovyalis caffra]|uniref:Uncharacterized protein n=1 Tax=Dovyalis caffra TaxID=77055 RepID=A0AAV1QPL5_9ROSI|nr:unnamed protein product [Dovyalis caffra]
MGISASKRVKTTLSNSQEFNSACDSTFTHCLSLTQHAFQSVLPYQLPTAATHLHTILTTTPTAAPLILKWVPSPPTRTQIDRALRMVTNKKPGPAHEEKEGLILGSAQFREWALVLFTEAAVGNAGKAILGRLPLGVAGILGVGAVVKGGTEVVGAAIGVYALGVATSVYLSLSG